MRAAGFLLDDLKYAWSLRSLSCTPGMGPTPYAIEPYRLMASGLTMLSLSHMACALDSSGYADRLPRGCLGRPAALGTPAGQSDAAA